MKDNKYMRDDEYITKKYLDETLDKRLSENLEEFKRHNSALLESFRSDLKAMTEQFVTRQEVRDIVHEEINGALKPINTKLDMYMLETKSHGKRIARIERKMA